MPSIFDCNFEIYDDLVQRRSNLMNRLKDLREQQREITAQITGLDVEIEKMKGGVE